VATVRLAPGSRGLPDQLAVGERPAHRGGEGSVFFTADGRFVVKIYHRPAPDKHRLLERVIALGRHLGTDERSLAWPLGIVTQLNDTPCTGVVIRRVPPAFAPLSTFVYSPVDAVEQFRQGRSWLEYLKVARSTAAAIRAIHGMGMAHADIHLKNFLADPASGEAVLIDLDGLVVKGFLPPQVKGLRGFIAPEVIMGRSSPGELTDRHSTAVLILWILLFRNVMLSQQCYDDEDEHHDDDLGYGRYACFSEHLTDRRNWLRRIGAPLFRGGLLSYRVLTPKLQELTDRALVHGLHNPQQRPQTIEWERALAEAYDALIMCAICRQSHVYAYWVQPPPRRRCPFCGAATRPPFPAVLELIEPRAPGVHVAARSTVLYDGMPIFADLVETGSIPPFTRRGLASVGQTVWDATQVAHRLINTGDSPWQVAAGESDRIARGESVALRPGLLLSFGDGKRLARVLE
jgi:DNA-binding helix-hairpin-helix protein with protein kinase domain